MLSYPNLEQQTSLDVQISDTSHQSQLASEIDSTAIQKSLVVSSIFDQSKRNFFKTEMEKTSPRQAKKAVAKDASYSKNIDARSQSRNSRETSSKISLSKAGANSKNAVPGKLAFGHPREPKQL